MTPEQVAIQIIQRAVVRFGKGFVSGGIAALATIQPPMGTTTGDITAWIHVVVAAFIVGGVLGLEKLLSQVYVPSTTNTPTTQVSNQGSTSLENAFSNQAKIVATSAVITPVVTETATQTQDQVQ